MNTNKELEANMIKYLVSGTKESAVMFAREHNLSRREVKSIPLYDPPRTARLAGMGGLKDEQLIGRFSDRERYFLTMKLS